MNYDHDFIERLRSGNQTRQRIIESIAKADREARKATYSATSPDGTVLVIMSGEFRVKDIAIHPEAYETIDPDDLADSLISTYNLARKIVHGGHLQHVLNPTSTDRRETHRG